MEKEKNELPEESSDEEKTPYEKAKLMLNGVNGLVDSLKSLPPGSKIVRIYNPKTGKVYLDKTNEDT